VSRRRAINPHADVVAHRARLTSDSAMAPLDAYDGIVDGGLRDR